MPHEPLALTTPALAMRPSRSFVARLAFPSALALMGLLLTVPTLAADRDGDGLRDAFERKHGITDPDKRDSDHDGVIDSAEDDDGDRLGNLGEQRFKTDPGKKDSDGDGINDGNEDSDRDGRSDAREQDRRRVPKGLKPSLARAKKDRPASYDRCFLNRGESKLRRCVYGDTDSKTTVALFGDSHMFMWNPGFDKAARKEGWKVVTMAHSGCPSVQVPTFGQYLLDRHRSCRKWRDSALQWLRDHPPEIIVINNSDGYKIVDSKGRKVPDSERPIRWKTGLGKTLAALPEESAVLVLGDTPHNERNPVNCLKRHPKNMSACTTRRTAPLQLVFEPVEREAAAEAGVAFGSLFDKVCSYDPCPLVQGKTMMWRDQFHVTSTMARKLAPSIRTLLRGALAAD